ncbi:phage integrase SAM-like domain-containing protein [Schleiferiaceae bacterium]|nr:phage integrase SAM-like domain-containing protein [Schleiferiaceae bacterium]
MESRPVAWWGLQNYDGAQMVRIFNFIHNMEHSHIIIFWRKMRISKKNPNGDLGKLTVRINWGGSDYRPQKAIGISLLKHEWDPIQRKMLSGAKHRLGETLYNQYSRRIREIESKIFENVEALRLGEKSIDQALASVLGQSPDHRMLAFVEENMSRKPIAYFKAYCQFMKIRPESFKWSQYNPATFSAYHNYLLEERKVSPSTAKSYLKDLRTIFNKGKEAKLVASGLEFPTIKGSYAYAGENKVFSYKDIATSIINSKEPFDILANALILLGIHLGGADLYNICGLKAEFYDEEGEVWSNDAQMKFIRFKRHKVKDREGVQPAYIPIHREVNLLFELINTIDGRYYNDYILKITETISGAESYWGNRELNKRLKNLSDGKNPIRWSGVRATFENYAGSSGMAEDIRFMIQGRTLKGSQAHYALTSSRLEIIHESHLKAMQKFKMPLVMDLLFSKAKELNVFSYPKLWGKSSQSIYEQIFSREPS